MLNELKTVAANRGEVYEWLTRILWQQSTYRSGA
jgi:hypothetical protein